MTSEITETLEQTASKDLAQGDIVATKLCSHNQEASSINTFELEKLPGKIPCVVVVWDLSWGLVVNRFGATADNFGLQQIFMDLDYNLCELKFM